MVPLSVLDLAPITEGGTAAEALARSVDLARHAEALGYRRFWLAEHHNMPGIASAATSIVIGHVAANTKTIRVGAGGIMLPNHSPLVVAEQFGTLATLFPGRIDLGLGRAPGTDPLTAQALRRARTGDVDSFPDDVVELLGYFRPAEPGQRVRAVPGAGVDVPVYILGSSLYGAQLAAALGLPYAFASHFAPALLMTAAELYRKLFRPSEYLDKPYFIAAANIFAADTEDEARLLMSSMAQSFVNLRRGRPGPLPPPRADVFAELTEGERAMLDSALACSFAGAPETVREGLQRFAAETGADELILACQMFDPAARLKSYALAIGCAAQYELT